MTTISKMIRKNVIALLFGVIALTGITAQAMNGSEEESSGRDDIVKERQAIEWQAIVAKAKKIAECQQREQSKGASAAAATMRCWCPSPEEKQ